MSDSPTRCGYAGIVGAPNAGKSTLLNVLLGHKLAIVSPRVQTTRFRLQGIFTIAQTQIILIDTPGLFQGKSRLDRAMVLDANKAYQDADVSLLLFDARHDIDWARLRLLPAFTAGPGRKIYVLNKMDLASEAQLAKAKSAILAHDAVAEIFCISALHGHGIEPLRQALAASMPVQPWLYPDDQLSDISERLWAAEITREQIFLQLAEEVPYGTFVETEKWEDFKNGAVKVSQIIVLSRDSYKPIILGQGGQQIKKIRQAAQQAMEQAFGRTVHLFLFVKIREDWRDTRSYFNLMGLEYNV